MGILSRFSEIISSNINALLDKAEDPEKMCMEYIRKMSEDLAEVKKETAEVIAEEKRCKKLADASEAEIAKYLDLAKQALEAGNNDDARIFIAKKQEIERNSEGIRTAYKVAAQNADKMRRLHDKLTTDIQTLNARLESIRAKVSVAKTQEVVNKYTTTNKEYDQTMNAFDRMEEKADDMLDAAESMAELNSAANTLDAAESLEAKYSTGSSLSVDSELESLRAELGL